jgi:hypothetical protein
MAQIAICISQHWVGGMLLLKKELVWAVAVGKVALVEKLKIATPSGIPLPSAGLCLQYNVIMRRWEASRPAYAVPPTSVPPRVG